MLRLFWSSCGQPTAICGQGHLPGQLVAHLRTGTSSWRRLRASTICFAARSNAGRKRTGRKRATSGGLGSHGSLELAPRFECRRLPVELVQAQRGHVVPKLAAAIVRAHRSVRREAALKAAQKLPPRNASSLGGLSDRHLATEHHDCLWRNRPAAQKSTIALDRFGE